MALAYTTAELEAAVAAFQNATVDTVSDLKAVSPGVVPVVTTRGRATAGDGEASVYVWNDGDTTAADGSNVVSSSVDGYAPGDANEGRWRIAGAASGGGGSLADYMTIAAYDADEDGVVDNSEQLGGQGGSYYLSRNNHSGLQAQSTITGLVTELGSLQSQITGLSPSGEVALQVAAIQALLFPELEITEKFEGLQIQESGSAVDNFDGTWTIPPTDSISLTFSIVGDIGDMNTDGYAFMVAMDGGNINGLTVTVVNDATTVTAPKYGDTSAAAIGGVAYSVDPDPGFNTAEDVVFTILNDGTDTMRVAPSLQFRTNFIPPAIAAAAGLDAVTDGYLVQRDGSNWTSVDPASIGGGAYDAKVDVTGDKNLAASDEGKRQQFDASSHIITIVAGLTFTAPTPIKTGTAGGVVKGATGVTLNGTSAGQVTLGGDAYAFLVPNGSDNWLLYPLAPAATD